MKPRLILFLCAVFLYAAQSWGQTWQLSETMTAELDGSGTLWIYTAKTGGEAMPDYNDYTARPYYSVISNINSVMIKDGVTAIGYMAFQSCTRLTSIIIPNSVTTIESGSFIGCNSLATLTIPGSVTSIKSLAFASCTGLTDLTVGWATPLTIDNTIFSGVATYNITLHVPRGTKDLYFAAPIWGTFKSIDDGINMTINPTTLNFTANSTEEKQVTITSNTDWEISTYTDQSWAQPSIGRGSRSSTIYVKVNPNTTTVQRTMDLLFTGIGVNAQILHITQDAASQNPTLSVSKSTLNFQATDKQLTFDITSNTDWQVNATVPWLTINPTAGSNNQTVTVTHTLKDVPIQQTGKIIINGLINGYQVSHQEIDVTVAAGSGATAKDPESSLTSITDVSTTSATINGWVNPNGTSTTYVIEISKVQTFIDQLISIDGGKIGMGTDNVNISKTATGLEPMQDYFVRIVAQSTYSKAINSNNVLTFRTKAGLRLSSAISLPATVSVGQTYSFTVNVSNYMNKDWFGGSFYLKDGNTNVYTWSGKDVYSNNSITLSGTYTPSSEGPKTLTLYYQTNGISSGDKVEPGNYSNPITVQVNQPTYYTVTFNVDGGSPAPNSQSVVSGGKATRPNDPQKTGYTFDGWYFNSTLWDFNNPVTANMTLKAHWTAVPQIPDIRMETKITGILSTVTVGQTVTFNATIKNYNSNDWDIAFYLKDGNDNVWPGYGSYINIPAGGSHTIQTNNTFVVPNMTTGSRTWILYYLIKGNQQGAVVASQGSYSNQVTVQVNPASSLSSDATLKRLTVSIGSLSPDFSANTPNYTVQVKNDVTSIDITAVANDSKATVTCTGNRLSYVGNNTYSMLATATGLIVGDNNFSVVVTAEDGTKKTYTVKVTRATTTVATVDLRLNKGMGFGADPLTVGINCTFNTEVKNLGTTSWSGTFILEKNEDGKLSDAKTWQGSSVNGNGGTTPLSFSYTPGTSGDKSFALYYQTNGTSDRIPVTANGYSNPIYVTVNPSTTPSLKVENPGEYSAPRELGSAQGSTLTFQVTSNVSWTPAITGTTATSWLSVTKDSNTSFTVKALNENNTGAERFASITVTGGSETVMVYLKQLIKTVTQTPTLKWNDGTTAAKKIPISYTEVQGSNLSFQASDITYEITPGSTGKWLQISTDGKTFTTGTISYTVGTTLTTVTIYYIAQKNDDAAERQAAIVIRDKNGKVQQLQADITQAARPPEVFNVNVAGQQIDMTNLLKQEVKVDAQNVKWSVDVIPDANSNTQVGYFLVTQNPASSGGERNLTNIQNSESFYINAINKNDRPYEQKATVIITGVGMISNKEISIYYTTVSQKAYNAPPPPSVEINPGSSVTQTQVYSFDSDGNPISTTPNIFIIKANCAWEITSDKGTGSFVTVSTSSSGSGFAMSSGKYPGSNTKTIYLKIAPNKTYDNRNETLTVQSVENPNTKASIRIVQDGMSYASIKMNIYQETLWFNADDTETKSFKVTFDKDPGNISYTVEADKDWIQQPKISSDGKTVTVTVKSNTDTSYPYYRTGKIFVQGQGQYSYLNGVVDVGQYAPQQMQTKPTEKSFQGAPTGHTFDYKGAEWSFTFTSEVAGTYSITKLGEWFSITSVDNSTKNETNGIQQVVEGTVAAGKTITCKLKANLQGLNIDRNGTLTLSGVSSDASVSIKSSPSISIVQTGHGFSGMTLSGDANNVITLSKVDCNSISPILTIPDDITKIGDNAFLNCDRITSVSLNKVTDIGNSAFEGCSELRGITIQNSVISMGKQAFYRLENLNCVTVYWSDNDILSPRLDSWPIFDTPFSYAPKPTLMVPAGSKDKYISKSWNNYFTIQEINVTNNAYSVQATTSSENAGIVKLSINDAPAANSIAFRSSSYDRLFGSFEVSTSEGVDIDAGATTLSDALSLTNSLYVIPVGVNKWRFDIVPLYYNIMTGELYDNMVTIAYNVDKSQITAGKTPEINISNLFFYNSTEAYQEDSITVSLSPTGNTGIIEEAAGKGKLTVYPNPTSSEFTLCLDNPNHQTYRVSLYNSYGQMLQEKTINDSKTLFKINKYPAGMYFVRVVDESGKSVVEKIIKK